MAPAFGVGFRAAPPIGRGAGTRRINARLCRQPVSLAAGRLTFGAGAPYSCRSRMKPVRPILVYLLAFLTFSCTVHTNITIHDDASGRAEITVTLHPVAVMYMSDIAASFGGTGSGGMSPFDIEAIRRAFLTRPGIVIESIETAGEDTLLLAATFDDVRNLLAPPGGGPAGDPASAGGAGAPSPGSPSDPTGAPRANPVSFSAAGGRGELALHLTRSNFHTISSLFVLPESPLTVLLPYAEGDFMPADEYLEVLEYALEDYLGGMSVEEFVEDAGVYAAIHTDRPMKAAQGGEISNRGAVFFLPLVEALTLDEDIRYSITW